MATALELLRQGRRNEIWKKYCGFIDLSLAETMQIQERLLLEQLHLLGTSELGRRLLGGRVPTTVEEFRQKVPLTGYCDYADYFMEKREDVLPVKPQWWLHTSGRSGEYTFKWVPYTPQMAQRLYECVMGGAILTSCSRRGEFVYEEHDTILLGLAPFPYISGAAALGFQSEFNFDFMPPLEEAEKMEFAERIAEGFKQGMKRGIDIFDGAASVLVRMGEQFSKGSGSMKFSPYYLQPAVLFRLLRGIIRSRLDGRNYLLPRDLWRVKSLATGGSDVSVFRKRIEEYWGRPALESYASTEAGVITTQLWKGPGLVFFPDVNFYEFIPEEDAIRSREDPSFTPRTVTMAGLEAGQRYEIVFTNFLGGVFTRYRIGDIIQVIALRNDEINVNLPHIAFYSRADDVIDLASFTRLTEKIIWQAIELAGVPYADWTARKEYQEDQVILHIYLEPKDGTPAGEIRERINKALAEVDPFYADLRRMLDVDPLRVTLLPPGTFERYFLARHAEGADLAQLKPAHMNVSERIMDKIWQAAQASR